MKNNALGYHIQAVLPLGSGRTSATKLQQRLHNERDVRATLAEIRSELADMLKAGLVSYSNTGTPRWGQPRKKRDPLPEGDPRRLTDARCAWKHMTDDQREEFLAWVLPGATGSKLVAKLRADGWRIA
jgi:hypothetical protein